MKGKNGADWWLYYKKRLPGDYITKKQAEKLGWENEKGNLAKVAPGKMIGGDKYFNRNNKLPDKLGRQWYEVDAYYTRGYRNTERIVYSNDGIVFYTKDHYKTFYEVTE